MQQKAKAFLHKTHKNAEVFSRHCKCSFLLTHRGSSHLDTQRQNQQKWHICCCLFYV